MRLGNDATKEAIARQVLDTVAGITALFRAHAIATRRRRRVTKVISRVEIPKYETGAMIEGYVDAELDNGAAVSWLLDVSWNDEAWNVEARLARSTKEGQEVLQELPAETTQELGDFLAGLVRTTERLLTLEPPELD